MKLTKFSFKKSLPFLFLAALSGQLFISSIANPGRVYAYKSENDLWTIASTVLKLEAFRVCVREDLDVDGFESEQDLNPWNSNITDTKVRVGYGLSTGDGDWKCPVHTNDFFSLLPKNGDDSHYYSSINDYANPANGNLYNVYGDDNPGLRWVNKDNHNPWNAVRDSQGRITEGANALNERDSKAKLYAQINHAISLQEQGLTDEEKDAAAYIALWKTWVAKEGCFAQDKGGAVDGNDRITVDGKVYSTVNPGTYVDVGYGTYGSGAFKKADPNNDFIPPSGSLSCGELAQVLGKLIDGYKKVTAQPADQPASSQPGATAASDNIDDSCESQGGALSWVVCPVIKMIGSALNWVDTQLSRLLEVDRNKYATGSDSEALYSAWSKFRNIGLTLLIAAMLVMVISTALGISVLDAYTVKKAFPRMVASIIFMLLSWWICIFLIDVSNAIGMGTLGIMTSPFGASAKSLSTLFTADIAGAATQGIATITAVVALFKIPGAPGILLSWLGTGLLVMGVAFLVLIARQMFIIVLILGSPLAILSWIFPGNDKLWKAWWQSFSKLLLMYPMVMALIASGRIFAGVLASTQGSTADSLINTLLKFTAYVVPYAFIPFTFKAAGGVFGNLVGMANDRSKGAFDRLKKGRQKTMGEIGQRMGAGQGFRGSQDSRLNRFSSGLASGPKGWTSKSKRDAIRQGKFNNLGAAQIKDNAMYDAYKNDEKFLLAAANEDMARSKINDLRNEIRTGVNNKTGQALTSDEVLAKTHEITARERAFAAARSIPNRNAAFQRQAALDLASTGYEIDSGQAGWEQLRTIARSVSGGDAAAYAAMMNNMQFALKGAGRFDQAGINNGAYYDAKAGAGKASLYELANGKKESIEAMLSTIPAGPAGHEAAVAYAELQAMKPNAKGAVADEINKRIAELESRGVEAYGKAPSGRVDASGNPVTVSARVDFDSARAAADPAYAAEWSATEQARGWKSVNRAETRADVARTEARTYQTPDPNNRT